jgi:hypothetical protein
LKAKALAAGDDQRDAREGEEGAPMVELSLSPGRRAEKSIDSRAARR